MATFWDIDGLLAGHVRSGEAVSLPVPIMRNGRLYDAFIVYAVDFKTGTVGKPKGCLCVSWSERAVVDLGDAFGFENLAFTPDEKAPSPDARESVKEARSIYESVREEAEKAAPGKSTELYSRLVREASRPSMIPYYQALGLEFDA